jgi:pimeloyl-ACP methyl ester carboxylesterase
VIDSEGDTVQQLNGFPYEEIHFGADGVPVDAAMRGTAPALTADETVSDVLFLCHGFMEDIPGARSLYNALTASIRHVGGAPAGLGVLAMMWPSEELSTPDAAEVAAMNSDADRRARFVASLRQQLPDVPSETAEPGDGEREFLTLSPDALFDQLSGGVVGKVEDTVVDLVNLASYYCMKARTTLVAAGLVPILTAIRRSRPALRIHLAGHSFGARVMAAALSSAPVLPVASVALLQGAFTHFGFALRWDGAHDGLFRVAVTGGRCTGPLSVTYSDRDETLRVAYSLASRLSLRQPDVEVPVLGGPHDTYGAIGSNGALRTPEARWLTMPAVGQASPLVTGAVCNLNSSAYISSHSAVTGPEVAQTMVFGMRG